MRVLRWIIGRDACRNFMVSKIRSRLGRAIDGEMAFLTGKSLEAFEANRRVDLAGPWLSFLFEERPLVFAFSLSFCFATFKSARISCSLRMECHPGIPVRLACCARSLEVLALRESTVIKFVISTREDTTGQSRVGSEY